MVRNGKRKILKKGSEFEIKIDYDKKIEGLDLIEKMVGRIFEIKGFEIYRSTNKGIHLKIRAKSLINIDEKDIIIIQLLLGSDRYREFFNWLRVKGGLKKWNILFKKKLE